MGIRKDFFIWGHRIKYEEKIIDLIEKAKILKLSIFKKLNINLIILLAVILI